MSEITTFGGQTAVREPRREADEAVAALLGRVGERVRRARELKGLPRRVISETSGVSMRYLAQLEAGEGNISIGLLKRVALALDMPLEWLLAEEDPWDSDVIRFSEAYKVATAEMRQAAQAALNPMPPESLRSNRVCLVGLRGAGKSTLGALAGQALGVPFMELNREIEDHSGMPVTELMALYGQDGYRRLEAQAVERVIATHGSVILAVAGGIVADPATYHTVLTHFHTVWVKASPEEHMARVQAQGDLRPMAGNPEAMAQLRTLLKNREALYRQAHAELDTSGKPSAESAAELVELIRAQGFVT